MKHIYVFMCFFASMAMKTTAQLIVTTGQTPQWYVQNVLVSGGVSISNVQYTGSLQAIGQFTTGSNPTNLGIQNGLVLSTGMVNGTPPIGSPVSNFASTDFGLPGDPLLDQIVSGSTYDATVLIFNFVPLGDTIRFRYVFASEEYPEYVGSSFNDVFGFFVSGPNPLGGSYNNVNIARIPNTTIPVTINNVNHQSYSQFFIHNEALGGQTIVFDGFTTVFTAWLPVVPCQQYTLKLAIADTDDGIYDSAVFLEANSFSSNNFYAEVEYTVPGGQQFAVEGCADAFVHFHIPSPLPNDYTINYTIAGTATYGIDYDPLPTSIVIPAGNTSATLPISPIFDGQVEGNEVIYLLFTNPCGQPDTVKIFIWDYQLPSLTTTGTATFCESSATPVQLNAQMSNGFPPYGYTWSHGLGNIQNPTVSPTTTTTYTVTAQDYCGYQATGQVVVTVHPNPVIQITTPSTTICQGNIVTLTASGAQTYFWQPMNSTSNPIDVAPQTTTTYSVTGTDANGCTGSSSITIQVTDAPEVDFVGIPTQGCAPVTVNFQETSGDPSITQWNWNFGDGSTSTSPNPSHTYTTPGTYTVSLTVNNQYNCTRTKTIQNYIQVWHQPVADFFFVPEIGKADNPTITFYSDSQSQFWLWSFGDGNQSTSTPPVSHTYPFAEGQYVVTLITYNEFGCSDTITKLVYIIDDELFFPNIITPNGDGVNDVLEIPNINKYPNNLLQVFNRWGNKVFEMQNYDNSWDGGDLADGTYYYIFRYLDREHISTLTIIRGK